MLEKLTGAIVDAVAKGNGSEVKILKVITEPFTDLIIQVTAEQQTLLPTFICVQRLN